MRRNVIGRSGFVPEPQDLEDFRSHVYQGAQNVFCSSDIPVGELTWPACLDSPGVDQPTRRASAPIWIDAPEMFEFDRCKSTIRDALIYWTVDRSCPAPACRYIAYALASRAPSQSPSSPLLSRDLLRSQALHLLWQMDFFSLNSDVSLTLSNI